MRLLGIDYGTKWIGTAISDESKKIAMPYTVLQNKKGVINELQLICEKEAVDAIVVGESKTYAQDENPLMAEIRTFTKRLEEGTRLPIYFEPEFLTSQEAKRMTEDSQKVHASAAALILQSYIDKSLPQ